MDLKSFFILKNRYKLKNNKGIKEFKTFRKQNSNLLNQSKNNSKNKRVI